MTTKSIKAKMKEWYVAWLKNDDDSYIQLFNSLRVMRNAGLITEKQWNEIYRYDGELYDTYK